MIYVMSDIYGHPRRFESIMRQINLKEEDTLYILGDVIDRYPYGIKLLRRIMKMPNVKMLLGNHEYLNNLPLNYDVIANGVKYKLVLGPCKVLPIMGNSES